MAAPPSCQSSLQLLALPSSLQPEQSPCMHLPATAGHDCQAAKSCACVCACTFTNAKAAAPLDHQSRHHSRLVPIPPIATAIPLPPPRLSMLGATSTPASIGILSPHTVPLSPTPIALPAAHDPMMDTTGSLTICQATAGHLRHGRCSKPVSRPNAKHAWTATSTAEIEDSLDLPSSSTWLSTEEPVDPLPVSSPATDVAIDSTTTRRRAKSRRASSRTAVILPTPATHPCPVSTASVDHPLASYPSTLSLTRRRLSSLPLELLIPHPTPHAFAALHTLDLSRNRLTTLPAALSDLANLRHLNLAHNHLNALPRFVCAFEYLESLILSQNQLTGALPPWLGYLTQLKVLKVDCNQFSGSVPLSWSALKCLQVLALGSATYGGNLINAIPEGILTHMHELRQVDLASNPLQHLPRDLFSPQHMHLACVNVEGNKLDTLPDTIHLAPNLSAVYAANNLLCRLPRSIMQCPKLEVLDLSGNALCFVPMELIVAVHRRRVTVLLTGNPFTRFHEIGQAVEGAVGCLISEEAYVSGAASSDAGPSDDDECNAMDLATHERAQRCPAVYMPTDIERAYVHPDAIGFNPQPVATSTPPTAAYPSPPSTPHLMPDPLVAPPAASVHVGAPTAATATPPLLRVPISLRELAARKSLHLNLCMDTLAARVPPRLVAMLQSAHGGAQCPRCASPVVGEYLATVEVERVLGHALVPVRKLYCSTECLVGREADPDTNTNDRVIRPGGGAECCGLGVNCCRVMSSVSGHRGSQVVLPGAASTEVRRMDTRPLGMIPANVVRSCLW